MAARDRALGDPAAVADLAAELRGTHAALRAIAERLRACERAGDFGAKFVERARARCREDDHRAALRRRIELRLGSGELEEEPTAAGGPAHAHVRLSVGPAAVSRPPRGRPERIGNRPASSGVPPAPPGRRPARPPIDQ